MWDKTSKLSYVLTFFLIHADQFQVDQYLLPFFAPQVFSHFFTYNSFHVLQMQCVFHHVTHQSSRKLKPMMSERLVVANVEVKSP